MKEDLCNLCPQACRLGVVDLWKTGCLFPHGVIPRLRSGFNKNQIKSRGSKSASCLLFFVLQNKLCLHGSTGNHFKLLYLSQLKLFLLFLLYLITELLMRTGDVFTRSGNISKTYSKLQSQSSPTSHSLFDCVFSMCTGASPLCQNQPAADVFPPRGVCPHKILQDADGQTEYFL